MSRDFYLGENMLKKLNSAILCATALFASHAIAAGKPHYVLGVNTFKAIQLEPNVATEFENEFFFNLNIVCSTRINSPSDDATANLYGIVLKNRVRLNGKELTVGQDISLNIKKADSFRLWAESGAIVEITNNSENTIIANCGLG